MFAVLETVLALIGTVVLALLLFGWDMLPPEDLQRLHEAQAQAVAQRRTDKVLEKQLFLSCIQRVAPITDSVVWSAAVKNCRVFAHQESAL